MSNDNDSGKKLRQRAILCVLGSSASFAIAAALVKAASPTIPVIEIMLFRSLFALSAMLPFVRGAGGLDALRTRHPIGHVLRTIAGFAGMVGSVLRLRASPAGDGHGARLRDAGIPEHPIGAAAGRAG